MNTNNLVNGYVLTNLFYELMFLEEHGIQSEEEKWSDQQFVDQIVVRFVIPRYEGLSEPAKEVVSNTLRYLLFSGQDTSKTIESVWQASSVPIPTPGGVRHFFQRCYELLFKGAIVPSQEELSRYRVEHSMQVANRLN